MSATSEFVCLPAGPTGAMTVPIEPWRLLLDLEARGFVVQLVGEILTITPVSKLTSDEREAIRRWKAHLVALMRYEPPENQL
jgi:hypothetical protein